MPAIGSTTTVPDDNGPTERDAWEETLYLAAWFLDVVEVDYMGCHLVLQPNEIGWTDNEYVVHAYQVGGESPDGGPVQRWWCLKVEDLSNIRLSDAAWHWVPPDDQDSCVKDSTDPPDVLIDAWEEAHREAEEDNGEANGDGEG